MVEIVITISLCLHVIMWAYFQTEINILNYKIKEIQ